MLKQATFYYNHAEGFSSKGKHTITKTFYTKSESLCEDALELLQEISHYDSDVHSWFDRHIYFAVGEGLSTDIVCLPRLVSLRSNERRNEDSRISGKQSLKLTIVEELSN